MTEWITYGTAALALLLMVLVAFQQRRLDAHDATLYPYRPEPVHPRSSAATQQWRVLDGKTVVHRGYDRDEAQRVADRMNVIRRAVHAETAHQKVDDALKHMARNVTYHWSVKERKPELGDVGGGWAWHVGIKHSSHSHFVEGPYRWEQRGTSSSSDAARSAVVRAVRMHQLEQVNRTRLSGYDGTIQGRFPA